MLHSVRHKSKSSLQPLMWTVENCVKQTTDKIHLLRQQRTIELNSKKLFSKIRTEKIIFLTTNTLTCINQI